MKEGHILIVDDDDRIRTLLSKFLQKHNFVITTARDTEKARHALTQARFDLIILDVMMPGEDGKSFAKILRKTSKVAILMLTALGEVEDKIEGLESGADDYLPKPFNPTELLLRIKKLIDRTRSQDLEISDKTNIHFGNLIFDSKKNILLDGDQKITLSTNEIKLLKIFIAKKNLPVTREEISMEMDHINLRSVDVQVTRLRNKIEATPKNPIFIQSIRNKGYVLYVE